ncbi:MAG: hypothetical protein ACRDRH_07200 [Pseudonocardia sp.]
MARCPSRWPETSARRSVDRAAADLAAAAAIGALDLAEEPSTPARPTDGLAGVIASVHDALPTRAVLETRWLAMEAGVPIDAVRAALVELERRGLVEHRDGRWRRPHRVRAS